MRWFLIVVIVVAVVFGGGYLLLKVSAPDTAYTIVSSNNLSASTMTLSSPAFEHEQAIPAKFTCDGEDVSPALRISDIPEGTQGLALIVHDQDAPREGGWTHWTMWNIPPSTEQINENTIPDGVVEGITDFGSFGYGGPCPPAGTHRYNFILYALDAPLELDSSADKSELEAAMEGHILDSTTLTGLYAQTQETE
jgi:Raf kinase inhibitor-like YbhB/YbcL family protein